MSIDGYSGFSNTFNVITQSCKNLEQKFIFQIGTHSLISKT